MRSKRTIATDFLIRPLGLVEKDEGLSKSKIKDFGFLEAFLKDVNHEMDYSHPLYLLFKQDHAILSFRDFVQEEYEAGALVEDYDYPDGYIVLVYEYPDKFKEDYDKIKEGRYSETSKEFKSMFPIKGIYKGQETDSYYTLIFNKTDEAKKWLQEKYEEFGVKLEEDVEMLPPPDIEEETLDIQKYYKWKK